MVKAMEQEQENYKSRLFHFKNMSEHSASRHVKCWSSDCAMTMDGPDNLDDDDNDMMMFRSQPGKGVSVDRPSLPLSGVTPNRNDKLVVPRMASSESMEAQLLAGKISFPRFLRSQVKFLDCKLGQKSKFLLLQQWSK